MNFTIYILEFISTFAFFSLFGLLIKGGLLGTFLQKKTLFAFEYWIYWI